MWDLAHSAGALPIDVTAAQADFAIGCTYKYLNGGPGAPAFIYVRPDHLDGLRPALSGWLGHQAPFAFDLDYRAGSGIERLRVGTPPVIALAVLETALDVFESVDMDDVRAKSIELSELFIAEVERRCPDLTLASPRDSARRGSQVSFGFSEGYAMMQALIERGVIGDFRAPDMMRFGFTPLYLDADDVIRAASILEDIVVRRAWNEPRYQLRQTVT
jgi:kynureninase